MTIKTISKPDTKPTPIVPQVWGNVFYINSSVVGIGPDVVQVGPDEWLDPDRYPTQELAEEAGLSFQNCCPACFLQHLTGLARYLRSERLE